MEIEKRLPKGTAMGTIFSHAYASLTMVYYEIQVYFIVRNTYDLIISKYFQEDWWDFLGRQFDKAKWFASNFKQSQSEFPIKNGKKH